ncbi:hypothetical protein Aph01nite_76890 [Acrocarpospora phusangensis]|uniref:Uncharacterized protein n=1 Tax=Acrocarpospora phusangensis TaxID=1070424 RepID=A0A919QJQ5_9ACTN|nr:hypothetical protein [Acrocarpospora phusangensis]GIH29379.1 hypothetical protein Aph01nite_76890 [Acrocarpospora phusangensis]
MNGEPQRIGKPAPKRVTETEDFVAAWTRLTDAYGKRVANDPAAITFYKDMQQRLTDSVNVGLAQAQAQAGGWSLREIGRIFGTSHVAILKRIKLGREIIARREQAAGVVRLADAVKASVPQLREQRAEHLRAVGVEDYRVIPLKGRHRKTA